MIVGGNHDNVNVRLYLYGQFCKRRKYFPQKLYKKKISQPFNSRHAFGVILFTRNLSVQGEQCEMGS